MLIGYISQSAVNRVLAKTRFPMHNERLMKRIILIAILAFFTLFPLAAQERNLADAVNRGNYLTVKVSVAGPGDEIYFWWGHIGLLIEDALSGQSRFYDWGIFSFDTENFYYNFAFGRLRYSCGVSRVESTFAYMMENNRAITLYTLDLPPEVKTELLAFAEHSILPENRYYWYHHFRDNCATRVRDIIDLGVGGTFKERYFDEPGRFTLRQHVRRHTWFSPFWDWILNFWMGQDIDTPITVWEEMFLPSEIALRIGEFSYTDTSGLERQLVSNVEVINKTDNRPAVLDNPPRRWPYELTFGLCVAVVLGFLRIMAHSRKQGGQNEKRNRIFRRIFGTAQAGIGLFLGAVGFLLFFLTFFTDHDYAWHNINVLFVNPLLLIAVPEGLVYAFTGNQKKYIRAELLLVILWTFVFLAGIASILVRLLPGFYQQNQPTQLMVLPFALVLSSIPNWISRLLTLKKR